MSLKSIVFRSMKRGKLRPLVSPLYDFVIAAELARERALDALSARGRPPAAPGLSTQLTAVIKTFERPKTLRRLVTSIRRQYPDLPVIVVDDSRQSAALPGVTTLTLPFDSGVSAGRNAGLQQVTTPFVMILDDDFIFSRHTQLDRALHLMHTHPQIDILGGDVVNLPFYTTVDYTTATVFPTSAQPTLPAGSRIAGLPVCDKVANFYIARTERLRLVAWDSQIKRLDHAEFFTRARGALTSVFDRQLKCLHAPTPFNITYMNHRMDLLLDQTLIRLRYFRPPSNNP